MDDEAAGAATLPSFLRVAHARARTQSTDSSYFVLGLFRGTRGETTEVRGTPDECYVQALCGGDRARSECVMPRICGLHMRMLIEPRGEGWFHLTELILKPFAQASPPCGYPRLRCGSQPRAMEPAKKIRVSTCPPAVTNCHHSDMRHVRVMQYPGPRFAARA